MKVGIIGTGMWGTTLAVMLSGRGLRTFLWARTAEEAGRLEKARENEVFLPGIRFPDGLRITDSVGEAVVGSDLVLLVVPAQRMRENVAALRDYLSVDTVVVSGAKGLEIGSCLRMSEVIAQELPCDLGAGVVALSGPNIAGEIARGLPATTVVAGRDPGRVAMVQRALAGPAFRVYSNADIVGVELGGALKNVVALAAGICDGLRAGDNAKAAIVTRGLAEMARLGVAAGAQALTFAGLAGLGDLVTTCASPHSRNRRLGEQLAQGRPLAEIQSSTRMVAEGVTTTLAACQLAAHFGVDLPIASLMRQVLFEGKSILQAGVELMAREPKSEFY